MTLNYYGHQTTHKHVPTEAAAVKYQLLFKALPVEEEMYLVKILPRCMT